MNKKLLVSLLILLLSGIVFGRDFKAEDPLTLKREIRAWKDAHNVHKIISLDGKRPKIPETITGKLFKNHFRKQFARFERAHTFSELAQFGLFVPPDILYREQALMRARTGFAPDFLHPRERASTLDFTSPDVLVSIPSTKEQFQPAIATGGDGTIYACWVEEVDAETYAVMSAYSTDGGRTFSNAVVVDNVGWNYMPRIAVYGNNHATTKVHIAYNYVDVNIYDIYDTSGTYLGTDTVYEGDVYYCKSTNGGRSFGGYQAIANNEIDLIVMNFTYDEGGVDIDADSANGVHISYYSQSDEGHLLSLALWIIYIILFGSLPPFWFDYTWYTVAMRSSPDGGGTFTGQRDVVDEWFVDNVYQCLDVTGVGTNQRAHVAFTNLGVEIPLWGPTSNGDVYYRTVLDPLGSFSVSPKTYIDVGYVVPGGIKAGSDRKPRVGYTQIISQYDYDVYYAMSPTGGDSFTVYHIIANSTADEFEPRIGIDLGNNPFITWTDARGGSYDIYCVWSEDGGLTLRSDQHRVDHAPGGTDQVWPGISEWVNDTIRRVDIDWWDNKNDAGDIYYTGSKWWRTNLNITLNDTSAHPMRGTLTLTYTSFGQTITRQVTTGYYVVYHDSGSTISLSQMSSGSDTTERWIYSETGGWSQRPTRPGTTYNIVYWNQYKTTFTVTKGNPPACTHTPPSLRFTYNYFGSTRSGTTLLRTWADVAGPYSYENPSPSDPRVNERWFSLEPSGRVLTPVVSPTYYHQWKAQFNTPRKLNDEICTHTVPSFHLAQRLNAGINVEGDTPILGWADCGSRYIYQNPRMVSENQRWHIPVGDTGIVTGIGPYEPGAYHQWRPAVTLIGPYCPGNTVYLEAHKLDGIDDLDVGLCDVWQDWTDCGTQLTFSEFTSLGWVARDPRSFYPVTSMFTASIRYGNVVTVTIQTDFGFGFVEIDGVRRSSPFVTGWVPASEHTITAVSPQEFGYTRYVFDHWSDGGDESHRVVAIRDTTFTAYYRLQYFLDIVCDYDSPGGEGWYDAGANATFSVTTYDSAVGGVRHRFISWTGTGAGSYTGTDTSHTVVMNNPITETANWQTQYYLRLTYTGTGGLVPRLEGEGWYAANTNATIITEGYLGGSLPSDTIRYIFDHWESDPPGAVFGNPRNPSTLIYLSNPYTAIAVYKTQYKFCVYNPMRHDAPVPAEGCYWYTDGDTVRGSVTSPAEGAYCVGYTGTGSLHDGTSTSFAFVIHQPSSVTWLWGDQFTLTVESELGSLGNPNPAPGTYYYVPGSLVSARVDSIVYIGGPSVGMRYICRGYYGSGSVPDSGNNCSVSFTIMENSRISWRWQLQDRFNVVSAHDAPNPPVGTHWFNYGDTIRGSVNPIDGIYRCVGYTGSGSLPSGYGSSFSFVIEAPSGVTWNWAEASAVCSLVVTSAHGRPNPPIGVSYFLRGTTINAWVDAVDDPGTGTRYICAGWTGTGPVPPVGYTNHIENIVMNSSGTLTWNWSTQYRLIINNPGNHDNPYPAPGTYWLNSGLEVTGYIAPVDSSNPDTIWYCTGYTSTARSVPSRDTTYFHFYISEPVTITWNWTNLVVPLVVVSPYGSPYPPVGVTYFPPRTRVTAYVNSPVDAGVDGVRYVCTGFTGTGSTPRSGTTNSVSFDIADSSTITWNWKTQYRLRVSSIPAVYGNPGPPVGDHWYDERSTVRGSVVNPDPVVDTMFCIGFYGTGDLPPVSPQSDFEFVITQPTSVTWRWAGIHSVAMLVVSSAYDSPHPYGTTYWLRGSEVNAYVDSVVFVGGRRIQCTGWVGSGSVPESGSTYHLSFIINEDSRLNWNWAEGYTFVVNNPRGFGNPIPPAGTYVYLSGTVVSGHMRNNPDRGYYCIGYQGTGDLPPRSPQTDFSFSISRNTSITWLWAPAESVVSLTVNSDYGHPAPYGTTYWIRGSEVNANVEGIVNVTLGVRAICTGWTGSGSTPPTGTTNSVTFIISQNSTISWNWRLQFQLTISNPAGLDNPVPAVGAYWYDEGSIASGYMTRAQVDTFFCIGYEGTGSAPPRSHQRDFSFTMNLPSSITWLWAGRSSVARLIVVSEHDSPQPYDTTYWLRGELVEAYVDSIADTSATRRFVCMGYSGTGSVPPNGTADSVSFNIYENSELTWNWKKQFRIDLSYTGCGSAVPSQEGAGWQDFGDTIRITTQTPIFDTTENRYYGFSYWTRTGHYPPLFDSLRANTNAIVETSYTLQAHYTPAHLAIVKKMPAANVIGQIIIDENVYDSTSMVSEWWGEGSYHTIGVSERDSAEWARYIFSYWSDRGGRIHNVGPISNDTTFIAYYDQSLLCVVKKEPLQRFGKIQIDSVWYDTTAYITRWWMAGSRHQIAVSSPDSCDTTKYIFNRWSDGGGLSHITYPISADSSRVFTAYYNKEFKFRIVKSPLEPHGTITFRDTTFRGIARLERWATPGASFNIGVSLFDIPPSLDTVYTFVNWSDRGDRFHTTEPISSPTTLTAFYSTSLVRLDITLSRNSWDIGMLNLSETRAMLPSEMITIVNNGNVPIDLGLRIDRPGTDWRPGYFNDYNQYVLRAVFNDGTTTPRFTPSTDFVKLELTWATSTIFGSGGWNILPAGYGDNRENLWLQFVAPVISTNFARTEIQLGVYAKVRLP